MGIKSLFSGLFGNNQEKSVPDDEYGGYPLGAEASVTIGDYIIVPEGVHMLEEQVKTPEKDYPEDDPELAIC